MMVSTIFHSLQQSQFAQDNVVILHSRCGGGQNLTVLDGEVAGEKDRQDAKGCVCVFVCVCVFERSVVCKLLNMISIICTYSVSHSSHWNAK